MTDDDESVGCKNTLSVSLPIDGYEVEVDILAGSIERALRRAEREGTEEYAMHGPNTLDLSKFATVHADPTDEKWKELDELSEVADD